MYILINVTVYLKKKNGCLSHIGYICIVFVVYNFSLQLQNNYKD